MQYTNERRFAHQPAATVDAGIKIVWKRRNVGYFVDLYREYMEDMNRVIAGFG